MHRVDLGNLDDDQHGLEDKQLSPVLRFHG